MKFIALLFFLITQSLSSNPFSIDFPEKENLTHEDYLEIQHQIRHVDIMPLLENMYGEFDKKGGTNLDDFWGRCSRGIRQTLIDPNRNLYPIKEIVQIGKGGDRCVVCCGPFDGKYPYYIETLIQGLKDQGFNGSFLYLIGGWPNPTGEEVKYVAVPYSFKIFMMLEAYKLGFNHVLWIDAACFPLRNINPLFDFIAKNGALLNSFPAPKDSWRFIFPQTKDLLAHLTGTNVLKAQYINTIVFGLKMNSSITQELIRVYYNLVRMGTPFLSCFPEEWVLTAIIGQRTFKSWDKSHHFKLVQGAKGNEEDTIGQIQHVCKKGVFFYHRKGR